jgi:hypothetical protein
MAANTARFHGAAQRLLVEGSRVNLTRNPRFEGWTAGVVGSGGVLPTNMSIAGVGFTVEVFGVVTVNGMPMLDIGFNTSVTVNGSFNFDVVGGAPMAASSNYTASVFCALIGGSLAGVSIFSVRSRVDTVTANNGVGVSMMSVTATPTRFVAPPHATPADATTGHQQLVWNATGVTSARLLLGFPQLEQADFASTPILPAVGVPAAATRGADVISAPLASLGLAASGASTTALKSLRTSTSTGASQILVLMDDGTGGNRYLLSGVSASAAHQLTRTTAAVGQNAPNIASTTLAGTLYKSGIRVDGIGNASGYVSGVPMQSVTGGVTGGLTTFRIGVSTSGTAIYWGEIERLSITTTVMSDAEFQAAVDAQA